MRDRRARGSSGPRCPCASGSSAGGPRRRPRGTRSGRRPAGRRRVRLGRGGGRVAAGCGALEPAWRGRRCRAAAGAGAAPPVRIDLDHGEDVVPGDPPAAAGADDLVGASGRARAAGGERRASSAHRDRPGPAVGRPSRRRPGARPRAAAALGAVPARPPARPRLPRRRHGPLRPGLVASRPGRFAVDRRPDRRRGSHAWSVLLGGRCGLASARWAPSAAAPSSAVSMTAISALFGTVAPSSARISLRTPSNGDGTSALTLSVMTSSSGSYLSTWSPGCLSHFPIVPSATLSPSWGIVTFATFAGPSRGADRRRRAGVVSSRAPSVAHPAASVERRKTNPDRPEESRVP